MDGWWVTGLWASSQSLALLLEGVKTFGGRGAHAHTKERFGKRLSGGPNS